MQVYNVNNLTATTDM